MISLLCDRVFMIMRIKKTPTEIKQERLIAKYKKSKFKKNKRKTKKQKGQLESKEDLKKLSYADFLNSKYWQVVRMKVLRRDKFKCVICNRNKDLQIHHDTYKNHFEELNHLEDLMSLCSDCHREHHYAQD